MHDLQPARAISACYVWVARDCVCVIEHVIALTAAMHGKLAFSILCSPAPTIPPLCLPNTHLACSLPFSCPSLLIGLIWREHAHSLALQYTYTCTCMAFA
jgi:hypothetical protein